ncbi:transposable element Tcb2 transposase [Trichonephila clavipes]|nr:transposable element Tcb2 transposase [Trichonephila clavipes]
MGLQFLFMDDNAPCHRTVAAEQILESEDIERMDWPARSPDLNPIEHVWDFLGRCLAARTLPPVTIRELRLALQDEWAAMPQQLIDTLILSMGTRCETCLAVRGDHIPIKDRMFLAGHPSQGCFGLQSHCAPCYFFNPASFYPSDFSFISFARREKGGNRLVPSPDYMVEALNLPNQAPRVSGESLQTCGAWLMEHNTSSVGQFWSFLVNR